MSLTERDTGRDARLETHETLVTMSGDGGGPGALWSVWVSTRPRTDDQLAA
jgi:hypothetical protein